MYQIRFTNNTGGSGLCRIKSFTKVKKMAKILFAKKYPSTIYDPNNEIIGRVWRDGKIWNYSIEYPGN